MLAFNIGLLVYCYLQFSPSNYLYYSVTPERTSELTDACEFLMRTHYFWWANSLNALLFGLYWMVSQHIKTGALIAGFGIFFFVAGQFMFKSALLDRYYIIFRYQSVPDELVSQPARQAGKAMGPMLVADLRSPHPYHVKNAIRALGAIHYDQVTDTLYTILNDWNTPEDVRFESYFALKQMGNSKAESYLRIFLAAHHEIRDKELMDHIKKFDY